MTANADLITAEVTDVLLVPNQAITPDRAAGKYYVELVQADGTANEIEVQVGLSDDNFSQITSGLVEGDTLIIPEFTTSSDEIGPGQNGPFGG
jgi:multidrug efflux pump subunit AcrA (membrane-fusion protein)